jgi:predicted TIM-barrel fold metal-dependent hydrolase
MDETLRELRWVAEHGFVSVTPPLGVLDPTLPPLSDDHYEPFWAACVDLGLTLSAHSGYGRPQSDGSGTAASLARLKEIEAKSREQGDVKWDEKVRAVQWEAGDPIPPGEDLRLRMSPDVRCDQMPAESVHRKALVLPRRLMWQLMLGGVFDRHPGLKLVMTNARADWVPTTLGYLDQLFAEGRLPVRERPSEYWQRHCAVAPSSLRPCEVELRKETGVRQLLFATDYPHPEGTWPNTHEWLRACLSGVPEDEARLILGENALSFYPRVDGEKLRAVARRIGPWPADILGDFTVDPQLVAEFHKCSGFSQAAEQLDAPYLDNLLAQDIQLLSTSAVSGRS